MENCYRLKRPSNFDIHQIFDCGQAFRFMPDNEENTSFSGVALGRSIRIEQSQDEIIIYGSDEKEFHKIWEHYFALDRDYSQLRLDITALRPDDAVLKEAMEYGKGIRLLRQEKWEALCSFIISQNNNIPRIRSLIEAFSKEYGKEIVFEGKKYYSFPSPEALLNAGEDKLRELKVGFRAPYIIDAASKVVTKEIDLDEIDKLSTNDLVNTLMKIKGVGLKVASCVALFGYGRLDAFPIDVWVKKVFEHYYPDGFDYRTLSDKAGLVQQYLFYYERYRSK